MRTQEQIDNLRRLHTVIEEAPDGRLNMAYFISRVHPFSCETAYCALGWAAADPVLGPKLGYTDRKLPQKGEFHDALKLSHSVFGLDEEDADNLFGAGLPCTSGSTVTKGEVLWNIDRLLEGYSTRPYAAAPYADDETVPTGDEA